MDEDNFKDDVPAEAELANLDALIPEDTEPDICDCGECEECIAKTGECTCGDCDICVPPEEDEEDDLLEEDAFDDLEPEDDLF